MHEPEVQSLRPLILSIMNIILLLLPIELRPRLLPPLVLPHIIILNQPKLHNIPTRNPQQDFIAAQVQRPVILAIDVAADNIARLHEHVVQRSGDGPRAHRVGVARVPGDQDGVAVGVGEEAGKQGVADPVGGAGAEADEGGEPGEDPDVGE